jgi:hypothetical protein
MNRRVAMEDVRLPRNEEPIAAVTILDRNGSIVRVVPATEFRKPETTSHVRPGVGRGPARSTADRARSAA